jgi:hypothetical protein
MNDTVVPACVHHGDIVTGGVDLSAEPTANSVAARRIRFRMVPGGCFHLGIDGSTRLSVVVDLVVVLGCDVAR